MREFTARAPSLPEQVANSTESMLREQEETVSHSRFFFYLCLWEMQLRRAMLIESDSLKEGARCCRERGRYQMGGIRKNKNKTVKTVTLRYGTSSQL